MKNKTTNPISLFPSLGDFETKTKKMETNKPHCWSKMTWIKKYPIGLEPPHSICNCQHGSLKCKLLTRKIARENKNQSELKP